jgi:hypothetical protein
MCVLINFSLTSRKKKMLPSGLENEKNLFVRNVLGTAGCNIIVKAKEMIRCSPLMHTHLRNISHTRLVKNFMHTRSVSYLGTANVPNDRRRRVIISGMPEASSNSEEKVPETPKEKPPLKQRIKDELHHYWVGSKRLVSTIRMGWGVWRKSVFKGRQLTRREKILLETVGFDLGKLVPFFIIVIVPFLEFALPVILKVFPNFLPSTFRTEKEIVSVYLLITFLINFKGREAEKSGSITKGTFSISL